jgi:predicted nuclease of predicted toxin-antitoxin system
MRFLIDMNLTPRWASALQASGHDAAHWSTVGACDANDSVICQYARDNSYVVITNDLDYPQILAHTAEAKPGIILLRGEPLLPEVRLKSVLEAVVICDAELRAGAILSLDLFENPRARLLPLR